MDGTELTMRQQAALLTLMAEAREMTNAELKAVGQVEIDRRDRERLEDLRYLQHRQDRQSYVYELTPEGWTWCDEFLIDSRPPARSGAAAGALYAVLRSVHRNLARAEVPGGTLFFQPDTESRVRAVYARIARRPGTLVPLSLVRERLADLSKAELDEVFDKMITRPDVRLLSEANRKALTDDDRKAAVEIGGQLKHLLAIEAE